jgi:translation initiation factor 2 alpha subunit (eIF-2alpha)
MKGVNYYAFIAQTVDSTFSSKFLQYYRSPDGKIFVRRMYNEGIDKIKKTLEAAINNINSQLYITNYDEFKK